MNNGLMSMGGRFMVAASIGSPDVLGKGNGDFSSLSLVPYHFFGSGMRGRKCSGAVEKVAERRQRRMIKNREMMEIQKSQFREAAKCEDDSGLLKTMASYGEGVIEALGSEVNRLEKELQKIVPGIRHVDIEVHNPELLVK